MLLANMAVAHKIYRAFPERALLRRHPPPQTKMLSDLEEFCDQMGLPMDFSSAGALNVSAGSWGGGRERPCLGERREAWMWGCRASVSHQGPFLFSQDSHTERGEALRGRPPSHQGPSCGQRTRGQGWAGLGPRSF